MTDTVPERPASSAEEAAEYRQTLIEHYHSVQQTDSQTASIVRERVTEDLLPQALAELVARVRTERSDRGFTLLKYRHTVGTKVVAQIDDGAPLPPPDQLLVASVTNSLVLDDQILIEVHMVIGAWDEMVM